MIYLTWFVICLKIDCLFSIWRMFWTLSLGIRLRIRIRILSDYVKVKSALRYYCFFLSLGNIKLHIANNNKIFASSFGWLIRIASHSILIQHKKPLNKLMLYTEWYASTLKPFNWLPLQKVLSEYIFGITLIGLANSSRAVHVPLFHGDYVRIIFKKKKR